MNRWKQIRQQANWPRIFGMSFFVSVLFGLAYLYSISIDYLMDERQVPLRHVVITGDLTYTEESDIDAKLRAVELGSFFSVDVNKVQARIESLPWIYHVSVRKKWPDVLNVHVVEQQVVARWNDIHFLNQQGEVFDAPSVPLVANLASIIGPQDAHLDALQGYQDLNGLLRLNGFEIEQLMLSPRFSWQLRLKSGVLVKLGTRLTVKRLQRFIDMYGVITQHKPGPLTSVDLRYDNGMAVLWRQTVSDGRQS